MRANTEPVQYSKHTNDTIHLMLVNLFQFTQSSIVQNKYSYNYNILQ